MIEEPSWNQDGVEFYCDNCDRPIVPGKELLCVCSKYGNNHEGVYCSDDCLMDSHPDGDVGQADKSDVNDGTEKQ